MSLRNLERESVSAAVLRRYSGSLAASDATLDYRGVLRRLAKRSRELLSKLSPNILSCDGPGNYLWCALLM